MLSDVEEYFYTHIPMIDAVLYTESGNIRPFVVRPESTEMMRPIQYLEDGEMIKPFQINDMSKVEYIKNQLNGCI